jgi:hypothetical protein
MNRAEIINTLLSNALRTLDDEGKFILIQSLFERIPEDLQLKLLNSKFSLKDLNEPKDK